MRTSGGRPDISAFLSNATHYGYLQNKDYNSNMHLVLISIFLDNLDVIVQILKIELWLFETYSFVLYIERDLVGLTNALITHCFGKRRQLAPDVSQHLHDKKSSGI